MVSGYSMPWQPSKALLVVAASRTCAFDPAPNLCLAIPRELRHHSKAAFRVFNVMSPIFTSETR